MVASLSGSKNLSGMKKNKALDLAAWLLVLLLVAGTPFIVGLFHTPPDIGPDRNPSILISFLTLLGLIILTSLVLIANMVMGWTRSVADPNALNPTALNLVNVLSKLIGGLFIISGFVKLQDITGFSYKLDDYWVVFQNYLSFFPAEFMKSISVPLAGFISVFEVAIAFALMTGYKMRITSLLLLLMVLFFTFLTGFSAITGEVTDCGCFGDALKLTPWESFIKDVILTAAILPVYLLRKRIHPYYRPPVPVLATFLSFIVFGYASYYTYNHLPFFDFRGPYKAGQDLQYNETNVDPETDMIIAHDFTEFCRDCGKNGYEGPTLYIVMYNMEKAPKEALQAAADLTKALAEKAPGIKVCAGTNATSRTRREMNHPFPEDFCFSPQDEKVLKTIVRSSPGYVLLKDGIVTEKWHYNDIPDPEALRKLAGPGANVAPEPPAPDPVPGPDTTGRDSLNQDSLENGG